MKANSTLESPKARSRTAKGRSLKRVVSLRRNPKEEISKCGHWWKPAQYPEGTIVCPLCWLPETTGEYQKECHCWDDQQANNPDEPTRGSGGHPLRT